MDKMFVLTDLDGTLLRPDAALSEQTAAAVTAWLERGHVISYATARSFISSQAVAGQIPWRHPVLLYNGALLFDPVERVKLGGSFLDVSLTNELIAFGKSYGLCPLLFALDELDAERVLHEPIVRSGEKQFRASRGEDPRFCETMQLQCPDGYQTMMLTYIGLQEELAPLCAALQDSYGKQVHIHMMPDGYLKDHYFLEISDLQANKSCGLKQWARHVGCRPEQITVFGDNLNDIGLFEAGGRRIAVGNAQLKLKAMADEVIEANTEDGEARCLQRMLQEAARGQEK